MEDEQASQSAAFSSLLKELEYQFEIQVSQNALLRKENDWLRSSSGHNGCPLKRIDSNHTKDTITEEANAPILQEEPEEDGERSGRLTCEANLPVNVHEDDLESSVSVSDVKFHKQAPPGKSVLVPHRSGSNVSFAQSELPRSTSYDFIPARNCNSRVHIQAIKTAASFTEQDPEDSHTVSNASLAGDTDGVPRNHASFVGETDGLPRKLSKKGSREPMTRLRSGSSVSDAGFMASQGWDEFPSWFNPTHMHQQSRMANPTSTTDMAIMKMHEPEQRRDPYILSPLGKIRLSWDILWVCALLLEFFITPIDLVFVEGGQVPQSIELLTRTTLAIFCVDIVLNFFTGFMKEGNEIMDHRQIIIRYLWFWFPFDVVVTVPWDEFIASESGSSSTARASRALRAQKMFKLLRFIKIFSHFKNVKAAKQQRTVNKLNQNHTETLLETFLERLSGLVKPLKVFATPAQMCILIFFMSHLHGALWAWLNEDWSPTPDMSVAFERYSISLWWAFSVFALGNQAPGETLVVRLLQMVMLCERVTLVFFGLGHVLFKAMVMREDDASNALRTHHAMEYLRQHDVSIKTQVQMLFSVNETGNARKMMHHFEQFLEDGMPENLRRQVRNELWAWRLRSLGLIAIVDEWEPEIVQHMCQEVCQEMFASRVVLFREGDHGGASYYVLSGSVIIYNSNTDNIPAFTKDMWIGERALINPGLRRSGTAIMKTVTGLMFVPAKTFHKLLENFGILERYHEYCSAELWKGLCGRCGVFGDHFADDCPLIQKQALKNQAGAIGVAGGGMKRWTKSVFGGRESDNSSDFDVLPHTFSKDLKMFMSRHDLSRLTPVFERLGIWNVALVLERRDSVIRAANQSAETKLSATEEDLLSPQKLKDFQSSLSRRTMTLIRQKVDDGHHFMFLSHFKAEAGTEAALMRAEFEAAFVEDQGHPANFLDSPVFLDSEDLSDLGQLCKSVVRSHNIIIMLTKGILTRPWCIVEICTAVRNGVGLVPVKVSKQTDEEFQFPNEQFYQDMADGVILGHAGSHTVIQEGFDMDFVCQSIRGVFKHIALPYSPHKSAAIRKAEVKAILRQCIVRDIKDHRKK